jgi:hypothetical protein
MSNTSPDPNTTPTQLPGGGDNPEHYLDDLNGEGEGSETESPQAKRARAEALAHARAARMARAKYIRLTGQAGARNRSSQARMQVEASSDLAEAQDRRIGGTEASLAASKVVDQLRSSFPGIEQAHPAIKPFVKAGLPYLPLLLLRPEKRGSGVGALVSDPRVWSGALIAGLAVGEQFKGRIAEIIDIKFTRTEKELDAGTEHRFLAEALDDRNKGVPGAAIVFRSSDEKVLKVDRDGVVKARAPGTASVIATVNGKSDVFSVTVK